MLTAKRKQKRIETLEAKEAFEEELTSRIREHILPFIAENGDELIDPLLAYQEVPTAVFAKQLADTLTTLLAELASNISEEMYDEMVCPQCQGASTPELPCVYCRG